MNEIVLITGASRGIGLALTKKMLSENFYVIGTSRNWENENFKHKNLYALTLDLSNPLSIKKAHKEIFEKFKHIDILINNAAIGPDLDTSFPEKESFDSTFEVNVTGTVFFTEPLINLISQNGMILNISSEMGSLNSCKSSGSVAYRMSKSALNMYTKILTNRLNNKIKVASIHPGWVKTTIAKDNIVNGRLTPKQSAEKIYTFLKKDFISGTFWNAENGTEILW